MSATSFHDRKLRIAFAACLALCTLAVYREVFDFDFVAYDDHRYVLENRFLKGGLSLDFLRFAVSFDRDAIYQGVSNWHPMTWLSYGADVTLFGISPGAMHAVNLGFHVLNVLLLFTLFDRTTRSTIASALVAALFAIHPLHVEAVAWIAERKELLAAFFGLLACHAWVSYANRGGAHRYAGVLGFAGLSLLAKPMWVTLPFLLLALDHWPLARAHVDVRRRLLEKTPLLALSILSSLATLLAQRDALRMAETIPLAGRILNAIAAPIDYLALTLWPVDLSIAYPHPYLPGGQPPTSIEWLGVAAGWAGLAAIAWWGRHRGYTGFGLAWFLISLVPVIGIVQVGEQAIADRYTYVSLIGIFALVAFASRDFLTGRGPMVELVAAGLATVGLVALGVRCVDQVGAWRDTITLYEHSLRATPNSAMLHFNLGNRLLDVGREREATTHFEAARALRPDWSSPTTNLAWLLATTDDQALADSERAVSLALEVTGAEDGDPNALDTLAAAYASAGDFERAEAVARTAVALASARRAWDQARAFEERRRLYSAGVRYVEALRPGEKPENRNRTN